MLAALVVAVVGGLSSSEAEGPNVGLTGETGSERAVEEVPTSLGTVDFALVALGGAWIVGTAEGFEVGTTFAA